MSLHDEFLRRQHTAQHFQQEKENPELAGTGSGLGVKHSSKNSNTSCEALPARTISRRRKNMMPDPIDENVERGDLEFLSSKFDFPHDEQYRQGFRDCLEHKAVSAGFPGKPPTFPYHPGTVKFDAYFFRLGRREYSL